MAMSDTIIVIPARMGSTRFPAKPLAEIASISMVRRTAAIAASLSDIDYVVATDHTDIMAHCQNYNIPTIMTQSELHSGSDRAFAAAKSMAKKRAKSYDFVINLQGDAPFTPPSHVQAILDELRQQTDADIVTPYIRLTWDALDGLRRDKETTPFSGTTLITDKTGRAIWFSKQIIPAIRNEAELRKQSNHSPIRRHIGLYGYKFSALKAFISWPQSPYEALEGLEQLRALENGLTIQAVEVSPARVTTSGIDTPEDLARAEALIAKYGDPFSEAL